MGSCPNLKLSVGVRLLRADLFAKVSGISRKQPALMLIRGDEMQMHVLQRARRLTSETARRDTKNQKIRLRTQAKTHYVASNQKLGVG